MVGHVMRKALLAGLVLATLAAFAAAPALGQAPGFSQGSLLKRFRHGPMAGVEEVVFAVRGMGGDGHWYANFGYHVSNPRAMQYGPPGGQLCRLNLRTGQVAVLWDDPKGGIRDPQVHYDARKVLFSYRKGDSLQYHLYEINVDGTGLRQLTDGPYDEIEPTYLPDGDIVFCSSRAKRWVQCWFTQVATLHRSDGDGASVRPISANVEQDNTPWVMPDGRLLYMRWEYVDRSRVQYHHLWTINPDGTGQMTYFGNMHPGTVMLDAKPVPGTDKVVASFSPGHGQKEHAGYVTVVSPDAGPDAKAFARRISGDSNWRDPWAFSEDCFMAARDRSLWVMDGAGRAEPFYTLPPSAARMDIHEPRPLAPRPREPVIPPRVNWSQPTGRLVLADVTHGRNMRGVQPGEVRKLLVLESLPKPVNFSGDMEPLSLGGTFTLPRILGTVPVEPDGSACFEVPALRPVFFVALDESGLSVKRMQSFVSVMPGETTGCVGCHENRNDAPRAKPSLAAMARPPSRIEPFKDAPQVFDFPRNIQPILDKYCVGCHNYEKYCGKAVLTGDRGPWYSHAYVTLMSRGQVSHGRDAGSNYPPRAIGTSASPLVKRIAGGHNDIQVTPREAILVRLWIESGAPYPGTYASLGTGMVSVDVDDDVAARRCASCHAAKDPRRPAQFRTHRDLLANLTRPEKSLLLLAPLAKAAGGLGLCAVQSKTVKAQAGAVDSGVFLDTRDADYQRLLARVVKAKGQLDLVKRFDMPGFRPNEHYVREMKRFGILPETVGPGDPVDPYATDLAYWDSFWYRPPSPDSRAGR
jgi:hypothetical protein